MPEEAEETTVSQEESADKTDWKAEADKWKALARKHEGQAKSNLDELEKLKAAQDSSKSDMDKLKESIAELNKRAEKAEREALVAKVAQSKNLPTFIAERLKSDTLEDLEAEADEAKEALGLSDKDDDPKPEKRGLGRPKEDLQGGASNEDDDSEVSKEEADKIADKLLASKTL